MNIIPDDSRVLWRALLGRMEVKWSSVWASTFLLAWLTAKNTRLWKEHPVMISAVAEWWSARLESCRLNDTSPFGYQYFKYHVYDYDLKFPLLYTQSGAKIYTSVGFWKLVDSVNISSNQKGGSKLNSTEARICIFMSNCQLMYVLSLRCLCFQFATEISIAWYIIWFNF